jgi:hypothetical protein
MLSRNLVDAWSRGGARMIGVRRVAAMALGIFVGSIGFSHLALASGHMEVVSCSGCKTTSDFTSAATSAAEAAVAAVTLR